MTGRAQELVREALGLPEQERVDVAAEILASLDGPADADADTAWAQEITRRARRVLAGESEGSDWSEVRRRLEDKLHGR